jgi:hypothetical protein
MQKEPVQGEDQVWKLVSGNMEQLMQKEMGGDDQVWKLIRYGN